MKQLSLRRFLISSAQRLGSQLLFPVYLKFKSSAEPRKALMEKIVSFHKRLDEEEAVFLRMLAPSKVTLRRRETRMKQITNVLHELGGHRYRVEDCSMAQYVADLDIAPLELAIIDTEWPEGLGPGCNNLFFPLPYDHQPLASALIEGGLRRRMSPSGAWIRKLKQCDILSNQIDASPSPSLKNSEVLKVLSFSVDTTFQSDSVQDRVPKPPACMQPSRNLGPLVFLFLNWIASTNSMSSSTLKLTSEFVLQEARVLHQTADQYILDEGLIMSPGEDGCARRSTEWLKGSHASRFYEKLVKNKATPTSDICLQHEREGLAESENYKDDNDIVDRTGIERVRKERSNRPMGHFKFEAQEVRKKLAGSGTHIRGIVFSRQYSITAAKSRTEQDIEAFYKSNSETPEVWASRNKTIARVKDAILNRFGPRFSLACFGSATYGVGDAKSDLDLVVIDHKYPRGFKSSLNSKRLPEVYNVRLLASVLRRAGFKDIVSIPRATVPIVKFKDPKTGFDCDINVNDPLGLMNTKLLSVYCNFRTDLKMMIYFIKKWAKNVGLNDPSGSHGPASFSSYALTLMTIGYLQVAGLLPNLQADLPPLKEASKKKGDDLLWVRTSKGQLACDARFRETTEWKPREDVTMHAILTDWFRFWGSEFDHRQHILSMRHGQILLRSDRNEKQEKRKEAKAKRKQRRQKKAASISGSSDLPDADPLEQQHKIALDTQLPAQNSADPRALIALEQDEVKSGSVVEEQTDETEILNIDKGLPPRYELEPESWFTSTLVIVDPFVTSKNVCQSVNRSVVNRFKAECERALLLMQMDVGLEHIFRDDATKIDGPTGSGRGQQRVRNRG